MLVYECLMIMLMLCKSSYARLTPEVLHMWPSSRSGTRGRGTVHTLAGKETYQLVPPSCPYNTFPRSLATVGNLFLGTPCYLSYCGMRYSKIIRTWFLMSCYWRILFQKVKRIATPLLCGKQCPTRAKYDRLGNLLHILLVIVLSLVKLCDPCWEIYHALKIKITYTPHISVAPTLGIDTKICLIG